MNIYRKKEELTPKYDYIVLSFKKLERLAQSLNAINVYNACAWNEKKENKKFTRREDIAKSFGKYGLTGSLIKYQTQDKKDTIFIFEY